MSFTPDATGTYFWKATYNPATGDPNNVGSTFNGNCSDSNEDVVVIAVASSLSSVQSFIPNDSAMVGAPAGGNLAGSVKFEVSTTAANVSWRLTYTSTNPAQKNIPATCLGKTALTIDNGVPVSSPINPVRKATTIQDDNPSLWAPAPAGAHSLPITSYGAAAWARRASVDALDELEPDDPRPASQQITNLETEGKGPEPRAPRRRPTSLGERPGETESEKPDHRAPGRLTVRGELLESPLPAHTDPQPVQAERYSAARHVKPRPDRYAA